MRFPSPLLAVALSPALAAQAVWQVGSGGFAEIQSAIDAAMPGDYVQVASGTYLPFNCNKSLTIAANPGAQVDIRVPYGVNALARFVGNGGSIHVRGLHFDSSGALNAYDTQVLSGNVTFEQCRWTGGYTTSQCVFVAGASVLFRDCDLDPGVQHIDAPALRAYTADVAAVDSRFHGGVLSPTGANGGGAGIIVDNCMLHLVRCLVEGGTSTMITCLYPAGPGVVTNRGEWTWIVDCELVGGDLLCGTPGVGLLVANAQAARVTRTDISAGTGAVSMADVVGPFVSDNAIGLASATQAAMLGAPYQIDFQCDAMATLFAFASFDVDAAAPMQTVEMTWLPAGSLVWFGALNADASGVASLQTTIPNVPALRDSGVWFQAIDLFQPTWRVSPPVGGLLR